MNLANKITLARIFLVPVFLIVLLTEIPEYGSLLAAIIFIVAASTCLLYTSLIVFQILWAWLFILQLEQFYM